MRERMFEPLHLAGVPVFVYHGLTEDTEFQGPLREKKYWLTEQQFREQLSQIGSSGLETALLKDSWGFHGLTNGGNRQVTITFDDGLASDYRIAFPLLQQAGARGEFFLNTSNIGKENYLSWRQIEEMQKAGMSFQSHGHDHVDLTRLTAASLDRQLRTSKHLIEDRMGRQVDFLAAPYGLSTDRLIESALRAGYRAVCTCRAWPASPGAKRVDRTVLFRHTTSREFQRLLNCNALGYLARVALRPLYVPRWLVSQLWPARVGIRVVEEQ